MKINFIIFFHHWKIEIVKTVKLCLGVARGTYERSHKALDSSEMKKYTQTTKKEFMTPAYDFHVF